MSKTRVRSKLPNTKTSCRSIRLSAKTNQHLLASSKYFGCTLGMLVELMLDATRLSPLTTAELPEETINNFFEKINTLSEKDEYLF